MLETRGPLEALELLPAAAAHGRRSEGPWRGWADRLDEAATAGAQLGPKRCAVPFVRQAHLGCVPATISALAAYWGVPTDAAAIGDAICYGGTSPLRERAWLEGHGFVVREMNVDWRAATALIDREVPFALTLTFPTWGHVQAVIGYDTVKGTFLLRDPSLPGELEANADDLLRSQRPHGPRGFCMVPESRRGLLDGLPLPDADRHDGLYRLSSALEAHDDARAAEEPRALEETPDAAYFAAVARRATAQSGRGGARQAAGGRGRRGRPRGGRRS